MNGAYIRFRIMAWVAGIMSLILWFIDIPVKYFLNVPFLEDKIDWIPIVHGYQYPFFTLAVIIVSIVSFLDDIYTLSSKIRFPIQLLAMLLVFYEAHLPSEPMYAYLLILVCGVSSSFP